MFTITYIIVLISWELNIGWEPFYLSNKIVSDSIQSKKSDANILHNIK